MAFLNYFFFYTYIGLVVLAGIWGAFGFPHLDFRHLFSLELDTLSDYTQINMLSQYRFLRALELGYGLFALCFLKEIFSVRKFNLLFLSIMGLGILARIVSWLVEGAPSGLFIFFLSYEALGWGIILFYSFKKGLYHVA